jgi:hypothetical protein
MDVSVDLHIHEGEGTAGGIAGPKLGRAALFPKEAKASEAATDYNLLPPFRNG